MTFNCFRFRKRRIITLLLTSALVVLILYKITHDSKPDSSAVDFAMKEEQKEKKFIATTQLPLSPVYFTSEFDFNVTHGPVVLITTNKAFLDFAQNWLESVHRLGTRPAVLAIAEDSVAYRTLIRYRNITTVMTKRAASPEKKLEYLSRDYRLLVNKRPGYIYRLLMKGKDVLFSDVDTVWLRDPLPHLKGDYDVILQEDLRVPKIVYCAGFIFFRATDASRAFVWEWMGRIYKSRNKLPDQIVLNDLFVENVYPNLRVKVLSSALFPNGQLYFNETWRSRHKIPPIVIHNNWITGHEEKVNRFKSNGLWYLQD